MNMGGLSLFRTCSIRGMNFGYSTASPLPSLPSMFLPPSFLLSRSLSISLFNLLSWRKAELWRPWQPCFGLYQLVHRPTFPPSPTLSLYSSLAIPLPCFCFHVGLDPHTVQYKGIPTHAATWPARDPFFSRQTLKGTMIMYCER